MKNLKTNSVIKESKKIIKDNDLLTTNLDETNFENLFNKFTETNKDYAKDKGINNINGEKDRLYKDKQTTGSRRKLRKTLDKFCFEWSKNLSKDDRKKVYQKFVEFYKQTYYKTDFSDNSIVDNRQDSLTQKRNKEFMNTIRIYKISNKL